MKLLALRAVKNIARFTMDRAVRRNPQSVWKPWLPWILLNAEMSLRFGPALRGRGALVLLEPTWFEPAWRRGL